MRIMLQLAVAAVTAIGITPFARATEVAVSAKAIERTLKAQLFNGPDGRYYLRGNAGSACFVYAEDPHVSFVNDRILVHVHTRSKLGTSVRGACLGVSLSTNTDVSLSRRPKRSRSASATRASRR